MIPADLVTEFDSEIPTMRLSSESKPTSVRFSWGDVIPLRVLLLNADPKRTRARFISSGKSILSAFDV